MAADPRRLTSVRDIEAICKKPIPAEKIEQLRSRPERNPTEKFKENHAVSEELKKQITELSSIRKTETVEVRIEKLEAAVATLGAQTRPLKKALNSALYSTDTELLELVGHTARETLFEIGSNSSIDPVDAGSKIAAALDQASKAIAHYKPDKSQWCSEWIIEENMDEVNELYNDVFKDADLHLDHFAFNVGLFHRYNREFHMFGKSSPRQTNDNDEEKGIAPAVYPFNVDSDFMLQLVDVERVEKQKKIREKIEKGSRKKETAELVKVNDKASNVQQEEVSISNELKHVVSVLKKVLKARKTDKISYYEFVTNPTSFSRTVENMFYVSYLMRDREVFLMEERGIPFLTRPKFESEYEIRQAEKATSNHGVTSLSYEEWKRLATAFKKTIIEPLEA